MTRRSRAAERRDEPARRTRPVEGLRPPRRCCAGVELEVQPGSLTAVLGLSGCGKTTLLRVIAGFERAERGTRRARRAHARRRPHASCAPEQRGIGYVPQEGALFPHLSVEGNVGFGLPRARAPRQRRRASCSRWSASRRSRKRLPHAALRRRAAARRARPRARPPPAGAAARRAVLLARRVAARARARGGARAAARSRA